jgi:glycosyltransferase involved in cell wall biosynthesis
MNICFVTSTFPAAPDDRAQGTFLLNAIECLKRAGHEVSVLTQARVPSPRQPLAGLEVVWFPWHRLDGRLAELSFGSPSAVRSAVSLVYNGTRAVASIRRKHGIDVFIGAWVIPSGLYLYLDRALGGETPYVLWALGSDVNKYKANPLVRQLIRRVARGAGHLYADGYELCDSLGQIAGRECEFLPTFRSIRLQLPSASTGHRPPRFLYVGRHAKVKGVDVLVDALLLMGKDGGSEYLFDIVGDGALTTGLKAKVEAAGLSARVRFLGRIDDDHLYERYASCDCVVVPSRSESIPLVLSEALQAGKALLVTDVGDMGKLVRSNGLGEVVPKEDAPALAAALRRFIQNPWVPQEAGRKRIIEELMFDSAAPRLLRRLEELVAAA